MAELRRGVSTVLEAYRAVPDTLKPDRAVVAVLVFMLTFSLFTVGPGPNPAPLGPISSAWFFVFDLFPMLYEAVFPRNSNLFFLALFIYLYAVSLVVARTGQRAVREVRERGLLER